MASDGPIVESDLVDALSDIAEVARRYRDGEEGGHPIDVLSLSMGYYHETPEDDLFDPTMNDILTLLGQCGVTVVCSAGNDATARPMFPAAFAPWADGHGLNATDASSVPVISVGALNPNLSDALFSNAGPWVRVYAQGAAVMSTTPQFQGGLEPMARTEVYQRRRESIDPDDFTGGFALWSGTSFSAPLFAGRLAEGLGEIPSDQTADGRAPAVTRSWAAVEALTDLTP
jgi:subtilisin family serine protease